MGLKLKLRPVSWDYPLVKVNKKIWKITMLLMGKSTANGNFH
jgi:hypothetical protein